MERQHLLGFGTMRSDDKNPEDWYEATLQALRLGCRHIDTAELYSDTAKHVGRAITSSGVERSALFVTSKLRGMPIGAYKEVRRRVERMLKEVGLERFDLLLIHWPGPESVDLSGDPSSLTEAAPLAWFKENIGEAWSNMLRLQNDGFTRHCGVSNFYTGHLEALKAACTAKPSGEPGKPEALPLPYANQLFIDVCHQEEELVASLLDAGIRVIAYRSLAFLPVLQMAKDMGDAGYEELEEMAKEMKLASPQQLVVAWLLKRGVSVIVGSSSANHMEENLKAAEVAQDLDQKAMLSGIRELSGLDMNETVEMCGGTDEYARSWREIAAGESGKAGEEVEDAQEKQEGKN